MNPERKNDPRPPEEVCPTKEARDKAREEIFDKYWKKLGLSSRDVLVADILDIGAGPLAAFGDHLQRVAKEKEFNCLVISIDKNPFLDARSERVDYNKNFRVEGVSFEDLQLQRKLELQEEPQFHTIVAMDSVPVMYAGQSEKLGGKWSRAEAGTGRQKIRDFIDSALKHLKIGGRPIFYPILRQNF